MNHAKGSSPRSKLLALLFTVTVVAACSHPVEIVGEGDIVSSSGDYDCSKEKSPCDFSIVGAYHESYTAVARNGHRFSHWENCLVESGNSCVWRISAEVVKDHWGRSMPPMRAIFQASPEQPQLPLSPSTPPFGISTELARFYRNISYSTNDRNNFDIFLPNSSEATGLIIYIHGGGFVSGDKQSAYDRQAEIREYLQQGIAYATINYRYLERNPQGLLASLNDAKRALQFMRYHANSLNINKSDIVVYGDSAGAGMALWLALRDDMAEPESNDPVLRETTRIRGAAVLETQASYDFVRWEQQIFKQYGLKISDMAPPGSGLERRILEGLNLDDIADIYKPASEAMRHELDMLGHFDATDPEIFVANLAQSAGKPTNQSQLTHHPQHALAIYQRAAAMEHPIIAYIPKLGIEHSEQVRHVDYLIDKVKSVQ